MNFFLKALIKKQFKDVPEDQLNMIIEMIEKNPDFFKKIADEIKVKTDAGMGQQEAVMAVMSVHKDELAKILGK
jgi:hypothetical protein